METADAEGSYEAQAASVICRLKAGIRPPLEVRTAMIGNVDSGKSTMVGVLTRSVLDDGRGFARSKVFRHTHEESTGRTSSIGQHNLVVRFLLERKTLIFGLRSTEAITY